RRLPARTDCAGLPIEGWAMTCVPGVASLSVLRTGGGAVGDEKGGAAGGGGGAAKRGRVAGGGRGGCGRGGRRWGAGSRGCGRGSDWRPRAEGAGAPAGAPSEWSPKERGHRLVPPENLRLLHPAADGVRDEPRDDVGIDVRAGPAILDVALLVARDLPRDAHR